jgi:hypothetical protein
LKPKTIDNYLKVAKAVVESLINDEGEPIFLRKWNHEFIDLPIVKDQHQPTISKGDISSSSVMPRAVIGSCTHC